MILLAMDRASVRRIDPKNGHMHVEVSNISKANICPYMGREIPDGERLGLDARRVYRMLRDPEELARAADSFNNLPILSQHVPISAAAHRPDLVVGTTGSQCAFDGKYLTNSLAVWTDDAIIAIDAKEKHELSSAYHYRADMTPGVFDGLPYDGVMRDIVGNHVALVTEGRAGPDVVVGDESMLKSRKALMVSGAVIGFVRPRLAQDAKLDLTGMFDGITAKNLKAKSAKLAQAIHAKAFPMLAADSALELDDIAAILEAVNTAPLAQDEKDEIVLAADADPAGDGEPAMDAEAKATKIAKDAKDKAEAAAKPAMDEATVNAKIATAVTAARTSALAESAAIRTAERDVHPLIGDIAAMDSAEAVYLLALDGAGIKGDTLTGTPLPVLKAMVEREVAHRAPKARVAMDAVTVDQSAKLFPGAAAPLRV
jgi:hypothetical protein